MRKALIVLLVFVLSASAAYANTSKKQTVTYNLNKTTKQTTKLSKPKPVLKSVPKDAQILINKIKYIVKVGDFNRLLNYSSIETKDFQKIYLSRLTKEQYKDLVKVLSSAKPGVAKGAVVLSGKGVKHRVEILLRNDTGEWKIYNFQIIK